MTKDVELHIVRCDRCTFSKSKLQKVVIGNIQTTHPLQLVHLDYLIIKVTEGGKAVHMLVIPDNFMWYVQALVIISQTARCTSQAFLDWFVGHYALPESIASDQSQNFKVTSLQSCASWQKYENCLLALTIHKQMGIVNISILH